MNSLASTTSTILTQSNSEGFTLPSSLSKVRRDQNVAVTSDIVGTLTSQVQSLAIRHRRPKMTNSLDPQIVHKLSQKFETRLKLSESASKQVAKTIELRRNKLRNNNLSGSTESAAPPSATGCVKNLVEKLRRKEKEAVARVLNEKSMERARQKKILIESLLPAQRREYIKKLEEGARKRQQDKEQRHLAKLQEEKRQRDLAEAAHQARLLKARQEQEERDRLIAIEKARIEAIRLKQEQEAQAAAQAAAAAAAAAQAQAQAEKEKQEAIEKAKIQKAKEEAESKALKERQNQEQIREPQDREESKEQQPGLAQSDEAVPDLSQSLLPQAILQARAKAYLQPSPEIVAQMAKQVAAWNAYETDMNKYKQSDIVLDKQFVHMYPNGESEPVKKVGEAVSRVANTISNPDQNKAPHEIEQELQGYADCLIQRMLALNAEFDHNPDVLRFAIFKMVNSFAQVRFVSACKQKDIKLRQDGLNNFLVNIFDRLHFQLPQMCLKEIVLGFIASRNMLFYPKNAQLSDTGNSEIKMLEQRGFRIGGGKREPVSATISRLTIHSVIFFSLHQSEAYIGRLFIYLSTILALKHTQNQAQIVLHLLEVAQEKLMQTYKKAFTQQLLVLKNEFCPSFRAHLQNDVNQEPQNKEQFLNEGDTGAREVGLELDKLVRLVDTLLEKANQMGF